MLPVRAGRSAAGRSAAGRSAAGRSAAGRSAAGRSAAGRGVAGRSAVWRASDALDLLESRRVVLWEVRVAREGRGQDLGQVETIDQILLQQALPRPVRSSETLERCFSTLFVISPPTSLAQRRLEGLSLRSIE